MALAHPGCSIRVPGPGQRSSAGPAPAPHRRCIRSTRDPPPECWLSSHLPARGRAPRDHGNAWSGAWRTRDGRGWGPAPAFSRDEPGAASREWQGPTAAQSSADVSPEGPGEPAAGVEGGEGSSGNEAHGPWTGREGGKGRFQKFSLDPLQILTKCRRFRYEKRIAAGLLVIQPMAARQVEEVVNLLTDAFDDYFGIFSYRPFIYQQVSVYMTQRVMLFPRGMTLVARLYPSGFCPYSDSAAESAPGNLEAQPDEAELPPASDAAPAPDAKSPQPSLLAAFMEGWRDDQEESSSGLGGGSSSRSGNTFEPSAAQRKGVVRRRLYPGDEVEEEEGLQQQEPGKPREGMIVGVAELSLGPPATPTFLTLNPPAGTGYMGNMAVVHEYRRQGVGRILLEAVHELAHIIGVQDIHLHCRLVDEAPYKLYASAGYETVSTDNRLAPFLTWERRRRLMKKVLD